MQKIFKQSFIIKLLAIITMVIDHVGGVLFPHIWWLRLIGRVSFPLFGYLLATGFDQTTNKTRYGLRLGLFAIISQYFYILTFHYPHPALNIFFTLFLAFSFLWVSTKTNFAIMTKVGLGFWVLLLSLVLPIEYGIFGVLCIISWYYLRQKPWVLFFTQIVLWSLYTVMIVGSAGKSIPFTDPTVLQMIAPVTVFIIWYLQKTIPKTTFWNVSNRTKTAIQYGFYAFYPLHLLLLYLLQ